MEESKEYGSLKPVDESLDPEGWAEDLNECTVDQLRASYDWATANSCYLRTLGQLHVLKCIADRKWDHVLYLVDLRMPTKSMVEAIVKDTTTPLSVFQAIVEGFNADSDCPYCEEPRAECDHAYAWLPDMWDETKRANACVSLVNSVCELYTTTVEAKPKVATLISADGRNWDHLLKLLP